VFRAEHWDLLNVNPELPVLVEAPNRVEVDLAKQVLYLVKQNEVEAVLPISSGNGGTYRGSSGTAVRARTPEGDYKFYKRVEGWRISYLGGLYRPFYFRGGYAIHGSSSVPPYPASHGCVRVELHDMDYLTTELELGMPVFVYGQRITREDLFPPPPEPPPVRQIVPGRPIISPGSPAIVEFRRLA
jgi:lipoprotein-anchoring transpeptidase ErfK/SrfK